MTNKKESQDFWDMITEDFVKEAIKKSIEAEHAAGRPVTYLDRETGKICRHYPDGHKEFISEK